MAKQTSTPAEERTASELGRRTAFTLKTPVMFDGVDYETISYRRPNGRDMRRFMNSTGAPGDKLVKLWADLCELPEKFFDELDGEDWTRLAGEFGGFLGVSPETSTS